MKKIISILMVVLLCFGLTGCAELEYIFGQKDKPEAQELPIIYDKQIVAEIKVEPGIDDEYTTKLNGLMKFDFYPNNVTLSYNGYSVVVEPVSVVQSKVIYQDGRSDVWYVATFNNANFVFDKVSVGTFPVNVYATNDQGTTYVVNATLTLTSDKELLNNVVWVEKYNALELINENDVVYSGYYIWNDGNKAYYSNASEQYVFNSATQSWEAVTWNFPSGITGISGVQVWNDGEDVYYFSEQTKLILNKETSTWEYATWTYGGDSTDIQTYRMWTDGQFTYCSNGDGRQYKLNKETSTWEKVTWGGFNNVYGTYVWMDAQGNVYYSKSSEQYKLNKETSTWEKSLIGGHPYFNGDVVWTDGQNTYYSSGTYQAVLNKKTRSWQEKTWDGINTFSAGFSSETGVWTDGLNYYLTAKNKTYRFTYQ